MTKWTKIECSDCGNYLTDAQRVERYLEQERGFKRGTGTRQASKWVGKMNGQTFIYWVLLAQTDVRVCRVGATLSGSLALPGMWGVVLRWEAEKGLDAEEPGG